MHILIFPSVRCHMYDLLLILMCYAIATSSPLDFVDTQLDFETTGSQKSSGRIVGGSIVTDVYKYSSFAIPNSTFTLCGATLIHPDILVSAAHCKGVFVGGVRLGTISLVRAADNPPLDVVEVDFEFAHHGYNGLHNINDIMLIKLKRPATNLIQPMPWNNDPSIALLPNTNVTVIGYGRPDPTSEYVSRDLRQVSILTYSTNDCEDTYYLPHVETLQMCAGTVLGGKDACNGDSGGPLLMFRSTNADQLLVGIVSYGEPCAHPDTPTVYTRVSGFDDWIRSFICTYSSVQESYCTAVLQQEASKLSCPAKAECGIGSSEKFLVSQNIFGFCLKRCLPDGIRLRWYRRFGWRCGQCV
jgi:secreted trypsin-like serine protease